MREQIAARLLKGVYDDEFKQVRQLYASLAERLYEEHYSAQVREQMYELAEGWLPEANTVAVNLGGQMRYLRFSGANGQAFHPDYKAVWKRCQARHVRHQELEVKARMGDDPVAEEVQRADNWFKDLETRKRKTEGEVWAVLESVHTLQKLGKVWPECWDKVKDLERSPSASVGLPAKRLTELSNELNLR
jgi:hypothetical protein